MSNRFGAAIREAFPLEAGAAYLNHGTVGVTPRPVMAAQSEIRETIEAHPARFLLRELGGRLRAAADRVAGELGGRGEDWVFVENATTGVNAVLRSLVLEPGDEILVTDQTYGAVAHAAQHVCSRAGARLRRVALPFPPDKPDAMLEAIGAALGPRCRFAILDHITSETALVLPIAALVARCRAAGVPVLVDGAHAPGQLALDVPAIGADYYVGNLHKWAFAPRSCAVLWVAPGRQEGLHPAVVSWGYGKGLTEEFDWTGTRDPAAALSSPAAFDFIAGLDGGEMRRWNHALVREGAALLGGPVAPDAMIAAMTLTPLPASAGTTKEAGDALRARLLDRHAIEVPVVPVGERLWLRLSAQVYNDLDDFERLRRALAVEL